MRLEITGKNIGEPTIELVTKVVNDENYRGEFFILIKDDESFLQATGPNDQLHVEYRDATTQEHFYCSSSITCDGLVSLCMRYINEEEHWNESYDWRPIEEFDNGSQMAWSISGL